MVKSEIFRLHFCQVTISGERNGCDVQGTMHGNLTRPGLKELLDFLPMLLHDHLRAQVPTPRK
jgi:hypothetical protein